MGQHSDPVLGMSLAINRRKEIFFVFRFLFFIKTPQVGREAMGQEYIHGILSASSVMCFFDYNCIHGYAQI